MRFFFCLIGLVVFFSNCKNQTQTPVKQTIAPEIGEQPSDDFMQFYEQFHKDSLFQIAHIAWPLAGEMTMQSDSGRISKENFEWQLDRWTMHKNTVLANGEFQRTWQLLGDLLVIERIKHLQSGFRMERRFSKATNGTWSLIFYSDM
jgi:hypothetical protein